MRATFQQSRTLWLRPTLVGCAVAALTVAGGCASSPRSEFLSLRRSAPVPNRTTGTTLAEAEMSNIGPSLPPKALATGR